MDVLTKIVQVLNWWQGVNKIKAALQKDPNPLRIGVLSAAAINYCAIIDPVQTHSGAIIVAIAARDEARAQLQIDQYGVDKGCKAYGSYAELLADPNVEAVYIPLPNGLHCEWAIKSLEAGKHVLLEKPLTSNAEQARQLRQAAEKSGKVAVEAFHWRFHPAAHRVKEIIDSGKYGALTSIDSLMHAPGGFIGPDDIRLKYDLAGGACMDATYIFSSCAYFACATSAFPKCKVNVLEATPRLSLKDPKIDESMDSKFVLEAEGRAPIQCHVEGTIVPPPFLGFIPRVWDFLTKLTFELEKATIIFDGFAIPTLGHSITITDKETGKKEVEKIWVDGPQWGQRGQPWWMTYRYQLEAFVDRVRAKEAGMECEGPWMDLGESEKLMEVIDAVYDKAGLPRRGT